MFDLEKDPAEYVNVFDDPAYRQTVARLTRSLVEYGRRYDDPRLENPKIKAEAEKALTE